MNKLLTKPKAELHIHLEGSLEPDMLMSLAAKNNISLKYQSIAEIKQAYQFNNLQEFLDIYYQGMSVLHTEQDYYDLTYAYLSKAHGDGVVYTEMFFDPQAHLERGISLNIIFAGLTNAIKQASIDYGINGQLIPCFLRHLDEGNALHIFEKLMAYRNQFIGIGLDSTELGHPPSKFKNLFRLAKDEGLKLVAHAGEEGPPQYVWEAIDILGVERIDHGNSILQDKDLVTRVAKDKIGLTMCPLSNKALQVVPNLQDHPIIQLLDAGVKCTVNSDDPAYFGGYINANYQALIDELNLTDSHVTQLIKNSLEIKFI